MRNRFEVTLNGRALTGLNDQLYITDLQYESAGYKDTAATIAKHETLIAENEATIAKKEAIIAENEATIAKEEAIIAEKDEEIARLKALLENK